MITIIKRKSVVSLLIFFIIMSTLLLTTCRELPLDENDTTMPEIKSNDSIIKITADYKIIRPDNDSAPLISAMQKISNELNKKSSLYLQLDTDWLKAGTPVPEKEILIGLTNRDESKSAAEGLLYHEFLITVMGEKVVIVGGSDEATEKAADFFINNYIKSEMLLLRELHYKYSVNYPVNSIKLNGIDIENYSIVYSLSEESVYYEVALKLNQRFAELFGKTLDIVTANKNDSTYEILLGNTNRAENALISISKTTEYGAGIQGSKVMIVAGCSYAANFVLDEILNNYLSSNLSGDVDIELENSTMVSELKYNSDLKLLSNNVLSDGTANNRIDLLYDVYTSYDADIIGLQECGSNRFSGLMKKLAQKGYALTCDTIDNKGNAFSYTPILYKADKYNLVENGCFLYDMRYMETNTKTLSYAVFEDKMTGKKFAVINTHFAIIISSYPASLGTNAVEGALWREDNARQVKETFYSIRKKYGNIPVFAMGDFNCNSSSKAYSDLSELFDDSINTAAFSSTKGTSSWHNVGVLPTRGSPIDHIFVSKNSAFVLTHEIPLDQNVLNSTDHCPVIIEVEFK